MGPNRTMDHQFGLLEITMATIVEIAETASSLKTLSAAIHAADLAQELSGPGPFTIFAPAESAFEKVPQWAIQGIFKPEAKSQLSETVKHHVVRGRLFAADVRKMSAATTMQGQTVAVDCHRGFKINGANILIADIICDNGVIHVIDTVIPPQ